jgi:hypothetical protein
MAHHPQPFSKRGWGCFFLSFRSFKLTDIFIRLIFYQAKRFFFYILSLPLLLWVLKIVKDPIVFLEFQKDFSTFAFHSPKNMAEKFE